MENQHKKIKGYRELDQTDINMINSCKDLGDKIGSLIDELGKTTTVDKRCLAIAKTDLQKGIMFLVRSIAQPESF